MPVSQPAEDAAPARPAPAAPRRRAAVSFPPEEFDRAFAEREFDLHYQPKIDLVSRRIVGAEGLARWSHPRFGVLPPNLFLDALDDEGRLLELSDAAFRAAAERRAALAGRAGLDFALAVNLSSADFGPGALMPLLGALLRVHDLAPAQIAVDVPADLVLDRSDPALATAAALVAEGHPVALQVGDERPDDFPEGFAGAFTEVKLGGPGLLRFARTAGRVEQTQVHAWLAAARRHGLLATAVGVETRDALAAARVLGFDCAQGFAIGAPMTAQDFDRFLDGWAVPATSAPTREERAAEDAPAVPVNPVHGQQARLAREFTDFEAAMAADDRPLDIPEMPERATAARRHGRRGLFRFLRAG